MAPSQECDGAGLWPDTRSFKRPSVAEVLAWSEQWASELRLWGCLAPDDIFDTPFYPGNSRPTDSLDIARYIRREAELGLMNQGKIDSVRLHHEVREEANNFVDNCLRKAGIPEQDLLRFKQVLPYKIALFHHIRETRPKIQFIPVWIYKKRINPGSIEKGGEDLWCIFLDWKLQFGGLLAELHRVVRPRQSIVRNFLLQSQWEYSLIEGINTKRSEVNSGFLRTSSDWRRVANTILCSDNSYDGRHDMHCPHESASSFQNSRESQMGNPYAPDIQKMDQIVMNSVDKDAINTQQSPASPVVRLSPVSLDAICLDGNQCSNFKHADPYSFRHGVASASPPHYPINEFIMQSQYITIWLDHNGRLDDYFEFPTINWTIPQLSDHKGQSSSQDWYFQDSLKISG